MGHLWRDDSWPPWPCCVCKEGGTAPTQVFMCMNTHTYTWPSMGRGAKIGGFTTSRKSNGGLAARRGQGGGRTSLGWGRTGCGSIGVAGDPRWCDNNPLTFPSEEGFQESRGRGMYQVKDDATLVKGSLGWVPRDNLGYWLDEWAF